jgi:hypothetical protein
MGISVTRSCDTPGYFTLILNDSLLRPTPFRKNTSGIFQKTPKRN